jgi:hypothetical protein
VASTINPASLSLPLGISIAPLSGPSRCEFTLAGTDRAHRGGDVACVEHSGRPTPRICGNGRRGPPAAFGVPITIFCSVGHIHHHAVNIGDNERSRAWRSPSLSGRKRRGSFVLAVPERTASPRDWCSQPEPNSPTAS